MVSNTLGQSFSSRYSLGKADFHALDVFTDFEVKSANAVGVNQVIFADSSSGEGHFFNSWCERSLI